MIVIHTKYSVTPDNVAAVVALNERFIARIAQNEPNFMCDLFANEDKTEWTCIEVAANADALGNHLAGHGADPEWMAAFQAATSPQLFEIYGDLPDELAAGLAEHGPQFAPLLSVADRTVVTQR